MALPSKARPYNLAGWSVPAKRRNAPDLTLRNLRAIHKMLARIVSQIKTIQRKGKQR